MFSLSAKLYIRINNVDLQNGVDTLNHSLEPCMKYIDDLILLEDI